MAGYSHKNWCCPFFTWDERLAFHCEGGKLEFPDWESRAAYADAYCAHVKDWKSCTVAASLLAFYDRTGAEKDCG